MFRGGTVQLPDAIHRLAKRSKCAVFQCSIVALYCTVCTARYCLCCVALCCAESFVLYGQELSAPRRGTSRVPGQRQTQSTGDANGAPGRGMHVRNCVHAMHFAQMGVGNHESTSAWDVNSCRPVSCWDSQFVLSRAVLFFAADTARATPSVQSQCTRRQGVQCVLVGRGFHVYYSNGTGSR